LLLWLLPLEPLRLWLLVLEPLRLWLLVFELLLLELFLLEPDRLFVSATVLSFRGSS
jgi:hypothetical protein